MDRVDRDRRRQLAEALQDALGAQARGANQAAVSTGFRRLEGQRRRQRRLLTLVAVGWALLLWLWVARPAAVFSPLRPPDGTPAQRDAALRYALYLQAARLEAFKAEHGHLPATLDEIEVVEKGLHYVGSGNDWALRGAAGTVELELTSRMSADSFLGRSLDRLRP